ncbi:MAG: hypothetical protein VX093_04055 [Pseudomonadota bacterium]|nr:hypothetical protein [Pseudomonadota bacterium]|tara:strand:- start:8937 stop:9137 length:201 start_codon:yes stop_codon:yes gene_type:complete
MTLLQKISVILFALLFASNSYAYLDPGTLNIIIQSIIAGAVAFLSIITVYWNKIISFISKFLKRKN